MGNILLKNKEEEIEEDGVSLSTQSNEDLTLIEDKGMIGRLGENQTAAQF